MKKMMMLALALVMMLTLTGAALAESAPMNKEDQMKNMVQGFLDENGYEYEYDDYTFSMSFALENALEYVNVMVFVDDDMLSVTVDAPIQGEEAAFEPLSVLTTLINSEIFYAQFRVDHYNDKLYVACRACNRNFPTHNLLAGISIDAAGRLHLRHHRDRNFQKLQ